MLTLLIARPSAFTFRRHKFVPAAQMESKEAQSSTSAAQRNLLSTTLQRMVKPDTGYEMVLFPFLRKVQKSKQDDLVPSDLKSTRSAELQKLAAKELTNLDIPERTRRKIFGGILLAATVALDAWLVLNEAGFWSRFATTPLLYFGVAYLVSGQRGLCNIAQSGWWQVEGEGLKKIQDPEVAKKILAKVNSMNATTTAAVLAVSIAFASIPL